MPELTLQLYSARNTESAHALQSIAEAGYTSVEAYGANFDNPKTFEAALKDNGLKLVSSHVGIDQLETNVEGAMELLSSFGTTHIVCPYLLPEHRPTDKAGWVQFADRLVAINAVLAKNGFTFAWHNHDFEFDALEDGSVPMQVILDNAPKLHWEIDLGWIARAKQNPKQWLLDYAERISAIHLKDVAAEGDAADEDGWADVGHGTIDWSALMPAMSSSKASLFIVEHDNPSDFKRFANNSITSINQWSW